MAKSLSKSKQQLQTEVDLACESLKTESLETSYNLVEDKRLKLGFSGRPTKSRVLSAIDEWKNKNFELMESEERLSKEFIRMANSEFKRHRQEEAEKRSNEIESLKKQIIDQQRHLKIAEEEKDELTNKIKVDLNDFQAQVDKMNKDSGSAQSKIEYLKNQLKDLSVERENLRQENLNLIKDLSANAKENERLHTIEQELKESREECKALLRDLADLKPTIINKS